MSFVAIVIRTSLLFLVLSVFVNIQVDAQEIDTCSISVEGYVFDLETRQPLPFVTVALEGISKGTSSTLDGFFVINDLCSDEFNLIFSHVGYKTITHHHDEHHELPNILLARDHLLLESIVIEGHTEQEFQSVIYNHLEKKEIEQFRTASFGSMANELSGVSMISNGENITKPVIHGLHSNRILIVNDGVRHEFQNWGTAHGPEIDPSQVDQLEVIKGAASVRFGSDALGGVLLVKPKSLELNQSLKGSIGTTAKSNGKSGSLNFETEAGYDHLAFVFAGSITDQGDLHTPKYNLTNTGKKEYGYSGGLRWHEKRFDIEARYSLFNQKLGILRGSVNGNLIDLDSAISSDIPLQTRDFSRNINQPFQEVNHQLFSLKGLFRLKNQVLETKYGYQINRRQEYDLRRGTSNPIPNIDMELRTQSLDVDWLHADLGPLSGSIGLQWQYQDNNNIPGTKTAQFIPNYNHQKLGVYFIENLEMNETIFEAGARLDYQHSSVRGVFQNERYGQEFRFNNVTASLGVIRNLPNGSSFRMNLGSAWRPPNVSELFSFGRHQSVFEYGFLTYQINELNEPAVVDEILSLEDSKIKIEKGFKWISTYELKRTRYLAEITFYTNYIRNYIYTKPAGITNTARGAFPYFIYDQDNALLAGYDFDFKWNHKNHLVSKISSSYVWSRNLTKDEFFVGTPPAVIDYKIEYHPEVKFVDGFEIGLNLGYTFEQYQAPRVVTVDDILEADASQQNLFLTNESTFDLVVAPDGYLLCNIDAKVSKGNVEIGCQIRNCFNISYRSYTNQMRYFADEMGRNFILNFNYNFSK